MLKNMFIESMNQPITNWLNLNYSPSKNSSIPRCIIYQHYCEDFRREGIEPLNTAMFGKVIKMAFPFIRSRRLGNRGNSKYHYFGVAPRSNAPIMTSISPEDALLENAFTQRYERAHKEAVEHFLQDNHMLAYQGLKKLWTEESDQHAFGRISDHHCEFVEREAFGTLVHKYSQHIPGFTAGSSCAYATPSESLLAHSIGSDLRLPHSRLGNGAIRAKTTAKTLVLLCKQISAGTTSRYVIRRMESYRQYAVALNALSNMLRAAEVLGAKHGLRGTQEDLLMVLGSGVCLMRESGPLDKSAGLQSHVSALVSYYINSPTFSDFISGLDSAVHGLFQKKERAQYEEMHTFMLHVMQEVAAADSTHGALSLALSSFFSEYFSVLASGLAKQQVFQDASQGRAGETNPGPTGKGVKGRSFVSQIITQP